MAFARNVTFDKYDGLSIGKKRYRRPGSAWTQATNYDVVCLQCRDDGTTSDVAGYCRECRDPLCIKCITQHRKSRASKTHKILQLQCAQCLDERQIRIASAFCADCQDYLCSTCSHQHKQLRATRSHRVADGINMPFVEGVDDKSSTGGVKSYSSGSTLKSDLTQNSYNSHSTIYYVNPKYRHQQQLQQQPPHIQQQQQKREVRQQQQDVRFSQTEANKQGSGTRKLKTAEMIFQFDSNLKEDHRESQIEVVLFLPNTNILLYDSANRKLKLFASKGHGKCFSVLHVGSHIWDMCLSNKHQHEIYASLRDENMTFAINTNEVLRIVRQMPVRNKYPTSGIACWHSGIAVIASADVKNSDLVSMVLDGGNQLQLFDYKGKILHRMPCQITRSSELRPHCLASIKDGNQIVIVVMGEAGWIVKCYDVRNMCVVYLYKMKDHLFLCSLTTDEEDNIYILAEKPHDINMPESGGDTNIHQISPDRDYVGIVRHGTGQLSPAGLSYDTTSQTMAVVLRKIGGRQNELGIFSLH